MPNKTTCTQCKGEGQIEVLVHHADDKTEIIDCLACNGTGSIFEMTDEEEQDYHDDYW